MPGIIYGWGSINEQRAVWEYTCRNRYYETTLNNFNIIGKSNYILLLRYNEKKMFVCKS